MKVARVILGILLATSALAAAAREGAATAIGRNFEVRMQDNKFDAKDIEIRVGDTVTWINDGPDNTHSATSEAGSEVTFTEVVVNVGKASKRVKFDKEGLAKYRCKFHSGSMKGTITVKKAS